MVVGNRTEGSCATPVGVFEVACRGAEHALTCVALGCVGVVLGESGERGRATKQQSRAGHKRTSWEAMCNVGMGRERACVPGIPGIPWKLRLRR